MTQRKKRNIDEINREIMTYKSNISRSQGQIIGKFSTPKKDTRSIEPSTNFSTSNAKEIGNEYDENIVNYIKNLTQLRDNLQEKTYMIETEYQKERIQTENENKQLKAEIEEVANIIQARQQEIKQKNDTISVFKNQIAQLQKLIQQKQIFIKTIGDELAFYKKQSTEVKLQNKTIKADNKVIMNHLDRLTKQVKTTENKKDSLSQRQMRVMKSLYQETLPNIELKQSIMREEHMSDLTNRIIADNVTDRNGQLKSLIRRLNEEIQLLKRQKQLLSQQNKQKTMNFLNQKYLNLMTQQQCKKLNNILLKMGQKIMSLQNINTTLRDAIKKQEDQDTYSDNYMKTTKAKAGQFYYKK